MKSKDIYLLWDRKLEIVEGATTDRKRAEEMAGILNKARANGVKRYVVSVLKDFAK